MTDVRDCEHPATVLDWLCYHGDFGNLERREQALAMIENRWPIIFAGGQLVDIPIDWPGEA